MPILQLFISHQILSNFALPTKDVSPVINEFGKKGVGKSISELKEERAFRQIGWGKVRCALLLLSLSHEYNELCLYEIDGFESGGGAEPNSSI